MCPPYPRRIPRASVLRLSFFNFSEQGQGLAALRSNYLSGTSPPKLHKPLAASLQPKTFPAWPEPSESSSILKVDREGVAYSNTYSTSVRRDSATIHFNTTARSVPRL
jgi:hypothetical protein